MCKENSPDKIQSLFIFIFTFICKEVEVCDSHVFSTCLPSPNHLMRWIKFFFERSILFLRLYLRDRLLYYRLTVRFLKLLYLCILKLTFFKLRLLLTKFAESKKKCIFWMRKTYILEKIIQKVKKNFFSDALYVRGFQHSF